MFSPDKASKAEVARETIPPIIPPYRVSPATFAVVFILSPEVS